MSTAPQSEAVQRALGFEKGGAVSPTSTVATVPRIGEAVETQFKSDLLKKLGAGAPISSSPHAATFQYTRCKSCQTPIRFDAGQVALTCPKCQAINTRQEA